MPSHDIALIGLGVMGQNLVLNIDRHGFAVAVYNRTRSVTEQFVAGRAQGTAVKACYSMQELIAALKTPRRVLLMVKAGSPVDAVIQEVRPHLQAGDLLIDGGNSHFADTARRSQELQAPGIHFLGVGISGGEEGALRGPSIMPGGPQAAYELVRPIFEAIAARADDGAPCVAYLGPVGAGHYVKMVHNGIEYAVMQLIAEAYDLLQRGLGTPSDALARAFDEWSRAELASYLMEITAAILRRGDPETGKPMTEVILDSAEQKGTGRWTVQEALELGVPIPTISAAVEARGLSALKAQRVAASRRLSGPAAEPPGDRQSIETAARHSLYAGTVCAYAQGMALLQRASGERGFGVNVAEAARIWRAGCIIRAAMLEDIRRAYAAEPGLSNLLLASPFREELGKRQPGWRLALETSLRVGVPAPSGSASLAYYDGYRSARLPANLTQAQRDYFGAHTYQRIDREGTFHTDWLAEDES